MNGKPIPSSRNQIRQIVLQPSTFCNINCSYCYLPDRISHKKMSIETISQLCTRLLAYGNFAGRLEIRWHAGEPLAVPVQFYEQALEIIHSRLHGLTQITHSMQTNAISLTDEWCCFLKKNGFRIGVSIDGPLHIHDRHRLTKSGKGTFDLAMKGIALLKKHAIGFDVITVLTKYSLSYPDEIYTFLHDLQPLSIGFNVEETEGVNASKSFSEPHFMEDYNIFLQRIYTLQEIYGTQVRELRDICNAIIYNEGERINLLSNPLSILSVDWEGNMSTFSPELLSFPLYIFGNIYRQDITDMLSHPQFNEANHAIQAGVQQCKDECGFFEICGGGSPSNKLWENNSFNSTSSAYCDARFKVPAQIIIEHLENSC